MVVDPITLEIVKCSLVAITDEMGIALQRSSYSPNIKTRKDHTCSIFNDRLELLAQTAHQIGHLGAFPYIIKTVFQEHRIQDMAPGDTIIVNDPYRGGTHLPDIIFISPVFYGSGLWGFVSNLAHHSDVGGISPGSMPGASREIFQEGLRIPPVKLFRQGHLQEDILTLILSNVRTPEERKGDLQAQMAANNLGIRRMQELMEKYGFERLGEYTGALLEYTERRMRAEISKIPDGVYKGLDYMDNDGVTDAPIRIAVTITKRGRDMEFDFSETDRQRPGPTNCTYYQAMSLVMYTLRCLTDPDIPLTEGCYRPVRLVIPKGSALNPEFPAATAAGWEISRRIIDAVCRALLPALPDRVPAGSNGTMNQVSFGGRQGWDGRPFAYYETHGGGFGARPSKDGMDGVHSVSNTMNTPVEELELAYPVFVRRYSLREDSEGPGKYRGGLGLCREIEFLTDATLSIISDREVFKPWGVAGGGEAQGSDFHLITDSGARPLGTKTVAPVKAGSVLSINTAGGGGYGNPLERDRSLVLKDLADGKISSQRARSAYGLRRSPLPPPQR